MEITITIPGPIIWAVAAAGISIAWLGLCELASDPIDRSSSLAAA